MKLARGMWRSHFFLQQEVVAEDWTELHGTLLNLSWALTAHTCIIPGPVNNPDSGKQTEVSGYWF